MLSPLRSRAKIPTLTTSVQHCTRGARELNKTRKTNQKETISIGKEEIQLYLFTNKMIIYIENPMEYTKKKKN